MKQRIKKITAMMLVFSLIGLCMFGNLSIVARADEGETMESVGMEELQLLNYEEYMVQRQMEEQGGVAPVAVQSESDGPVMRTLEELTAGKEHIICENVEDLMPATNVQMIGETGMARAVP